MLELYVDYLIKYYLLVNLLLFMLMGLDKWRARKERWRLSEHMLWFISLLGGALGGLCGMSIFHHKTSNPWFYVIYTAALFLHGYGLYYLWQF